MHLNVEVLKSHMDTQDPKRCSRCDFHAKRVRLICDESETLALYLDSLENGHYVVDRKRGAAGRLPIADVVSLFYFFLFGVSRDELPRKLCMKKEKKKKKILLTSYAQ